MKQNYEPRTMSDPSSSNVIFESRIRLTLAPEARQIGDEGFVLWDEFAAGRPLDGFLSSGIIFPEPTQKSVTLRIRSSGPKREWTLVKQAHLVHLLAHERVAQEFNAPAEVIDE
jgi:hypothetical protein